MFIFKHAKDLEVYFKSERQSGKKYGFVPTMGALHQGHLSLVKQARDENDLVVCSIFVNPTQFNDAKDFELYPKTLDQDVYFLEKANCDVLFLPDTPQIYPQGVPANETYPLGDIETVLEGKYRPGHFQGVCQVMRRLMQLVEPDSLYIGQKDYQQCLVIRKLFELMQWQTAIEICPTLREPNGLAMSSRNLRLSDQEKAQAGGIFTALSFVKTHYRNNGMPVILREAEGILSRHGLVAEYVKVASANDLQVLEDWNLQIPMVVLVAAYMGKVRLIDNIILPLNFAGYAN